MRLSDTLLTSRPFDPQRSPAACRLAAAVLAGLTFGGAAQSARADESETAFKVAKIIFETNASACDLGIQISFDTEGIVTGAVRNPGGRPIYQVRASRGLRAIGGQTEGFLEGVEPQIQELLDALGCERDEEVDVLTFEDIRAMFPAGEYEFVARMKDGTKLDDEATLTYDIPDGPALGAPDGADDVDPAKAVIHWTPVTGTIPGLEPAGSVDIVGYQIIVYEDGVGEAPPEFNVVVPTCGDRPLPRCEVTVAPQFLKRGKPYLYEVLAIEESGNQTITEGSFETKP
jgi:hypothetical protein